jgi:hypothetical protein
MREEARIDSPVIPEKRIGLTTGIGAARREEGSIG